MIVFKEHASSGYGGRTSENAKADVTMAIASDYYTAGERLTKKWVAIHRKLYIALPLNDIPFHITPGYIDVNIKPPSLSYIVDKIDNLKMPEITLNIAGNGIYSLDISQTYVDSIIHSALYIIVEKLKKRGISIVSVRSGGQTGIDEAGLKAACTLGIPALCLAPKGWIFRDRNSKDISNETLFKARFV